MVCIVVDLCGFSLLLIGNTYFIYNDLYTNNKFDFILNLEGGVEKTVLFSLRFNTPDTLTVKSHFWKIKNYNIHTPWSYLITYIKDDWI